MIGSNADVRKGLNVSRSRERNSGHRLEQRSAMDIICVVDENKMQFLFLATPN
jgi:hypothetical protein